MANQSTKHRSIVLMAVEEMSETDPVSDNNMVAIKVSSVDVSRLRTLADFALDNDVKVIDQNMNVYSEGKAIEANIVIGEGETGISATVKFDARCKGMWPVMLVARSPIPIHVLESAFEQAPSRYPGNASVIVVPRTDDPPSQVVVLDATIQARISHDDLVYEMGEMIDAGKTPSQFLNDNDLGEYVDSMILLSM